MNHSAINVVPAEKPIDKMKLAEIADEMNKRMKELESRPENCPSVNARRKFFYLPFAQAAGTYITVRYKASEMPFGNYSMTKATAARYLQWLRAGNIGTHREAMDFLIAEQ